MRTLKFCYLVLMLVFSSVVSAEEQKDNYHLFIYQSPCTTYATLYYKLTPEKHTDNKDYIVTVAKASTDLLSITDVPDHQTHSYLNIYIGMAELCFEKLRNICNPNIEDHHKIINIKSIVVTNEIYMNESIERSSEVTPFKHLLNQALQKYNFNCDDDNIKIIEYIDFTDKATEIIRDKRQNKLLQSNNDSSDTVAYSFFIADTIRATRFPTGNIIHAIAFKGCYSSLGYKFSDILKKTNDIDIAENKLRVFVMDSIAQEEIVKQVKKSDLLDLQGRSLHSIMDEINNNESQTSFNRTIKGLAITKYCLDKHCTSLDSNDEDDSDDSLKELKSSTIEVIKESVDTFLNIMGKDVDFFKNSSVIVLTGDLFDSNIITNKYQEMLNKKIRETQIASEISIVNMLEIMPSLILAAEKLKIKN